MSQYDRRKFLSVGAVGLAATAVGMRAVLAQDEDGTPAASPEASPEASPAASPIAGVGGPGPMEVTCVDIAYEPEEFTIPANTDVVIEVVNEGVLQHDFNIENTDYATEWLDSGVRVELTVNLEPGDYVYYCSVPGHREAGMVGTLHVE